MTDDTPTPIEAGVTNVGRPLNRVPRPTSVDLPPVPERPVDIDLDIDDEDGCRTTYGIQLRRETADDLDRLAGVLVTAIVEAGSAYVSTIQDSADAGAVLRTAIARRAAAMPGDLEDRIAAALTVVASEMTDDGALPRGRFARAGTESVMRVLRGEL